MHVSAIQKEKIISIIKNNEEKVDFSWVKNDKRGRIYSLNNVVIKKEVMR